jgi:glucose-6-phosphate 1-dehydrogenase
MEPPVNFTADEVRNEKVKVLQAIHAPTEEQIDEIAVRAQYAEGESAGEHVRGYLQEPDVPSDSNTETYAALRLEVDNWRWAGVPFYLRTGKRLQEKQAEIVITFEDVPLSIYERPDRPHALNRLVIQLQPEESITLTVLAKSPGHGMVLKPVDLSLDFADAFKTRQLDAYERLLTDVINGTLTLFMRRDELEAAWSWIDPIRAAWQQHDERPKTYTAGSWGPAAASSLIGRDGFAWRNEL